MVHYHLDGCWIFGSVKLNIVKMVHIKFQIQSLLLAFCDCKMYVFLENELFSIQTMMFCMWKWTLWRWWPPSCIKSEVILIQLLFLFLCDCPRYYVFSKKYVYSKLWCFACGNEHLRHWTPPHFIPNHICYVNFVFNTWCMSIEHWSVPNKVVAS